MRRLNLLLLFILCFVAINTNIIAAIQIDETLLKGIIESAKSLVFPNKDVEVTYNTTTKEIYIKFKTPSWYKVNYSDFYLRWRDNQWVVLQEFKKANIPVNKVTVETNYVDMSGQLKFIHLAKHVDKYAKLPNDDLWLKTGEVYQKGKNSDKWEKIRY